jgi:hypothetical protein
LLLPRGASRSPGGSTLHLELALSHQAPHGGAWLFRPPWPAWPHCVKPWLCCFQWSTLSSSHGLSRFLNFLVGRLAGATSSSTSACKSGGEGGIGGDGEAMACRVFLQFVLGRPSPFFANSGGAKRELKRELGNFLVRAVSHCHSLGYLGLKEGAHLPRVGGGGGVRGV